MYDHSEVSLMELMPRAYAYAKGLCKDQRDGYICHNYWMKLPFHEKQQQFYS